MGMWRETVRQDVEFAIRTARKSPGFVLAAAGTLALGIGATTAIFSILSGVLLRPLPFPDPDRLVQINSLDARHRLPGPPFFADVDDLRKQSAAFQGIVGYTYTSKNLQDIPDPERIQGVWAERNLFRVLGVPPLIGTHVHGRRSRGCGGAERFALEAPLRWRLDLHWAQTHPGPRDFHSHRRDARGLPVPLPRRADRDVDSVEDAAAARNEPECQDGFRRGQVETRSHAGGGAPGDRRAECPAGGAIPGYEPGPCHTDYALGRSGRRPPARFARSPCWERWGCSC